MNGENYATPTHRKTKKEGKLKSKERVYKRGGKDRTKKIKLNGKEVDK